MLFYNIGLIGNKFFFKWIKIGLLGYVFEFDVFYKWLIIRILINVEKIELLFDLLIFFFCNFYICLLCFLFNLIERMINLMLE